QKTFLREVGRLRRLLRGRFPLAGCRSVRYALPILTIRSRHAGSTTIRLTSRYCSPYALRVQRLDFISKRGKLPGGTNDTVIRSANAFRNADSSRWLRIGSAAKSGAGSTWRLSSVSVCGVETSTRYSATPPQARTTSSTALGYTLTPRTTTM